MLPERAGSAVATTAPRQETPRVTESIDLQLHGIAKRFGHVEAVVDCDLDVHRGEILALLGPSGCGKTTLLNIIAGFEEPDAGEVVLRGQPLVDVPPNRRNVGLVFQHYALFPHLTIRDNIAYGLRARRLARDAIASRVGEMLDLLKLHGLETRYPAELSGGQRQRVALARALAIRPLLLLLDEALSALDKNLREQMQVELSLLLRQLAITTIIVTHDQREAFSMAHRIALMDRGRIVQSGMPAEVYAQPRTSFVLEFLGSANCLQGTAMPQEDGSVEIRTATGIIIRQPASATGPGAGDVRVYIRTEDLRLSKTPTMAQPHEPGHVALVTFLGPVKRYVVFIGAQQVLVEIHSGVPDAGAAVGDAVYLDVDAARCHVVRGA
jgi:ABC-type Fe3+/spermidine/putrescine transport system ATPase subunit